MPSSVLPRYPIYIPSKGRATRCLTARALVKDGIPFRLVVEPQEADAYAAEFGRDCLLILPFSNLGLGSIPARNWIKDHAIAHGAIRHWQLDDNIRVFWRRYHARRVYCEAGVALRVCEDFTDRYQNVAVSGLNYGMFVPDGELVPPFYANVRVYSCSLVLNATPHRWRGRYNEDTDYCLQVLADGWCTILLNAFLAQKIGTMTMKGGNSAELYQDDGRLKMARSLERVWPGVVTSGRRFKRPQHFVKDAWRRFDTPLILRPDVDLAALKAQADNDYGLKLKAKKAPRSHVIRRVLETAQSEGKA